jgi:hypothetical protein
MIRTMNRNSKQETLDSEIVKLKENMCKSGYKIEKLDELENKVKQRISQINVAPQQETITFPISYFNDIDEFKKLVKSMKNDLTAVMGEVRIVFAVRKGRSIANQLIKNKSLCIDEMNDNQLDQKCNGPGCMQCPLVANANEVEVNNKKVNVHVNLNCKTNNVIYLWRCNICSHENAYFGRTIQKCHKRTNGHRGCFNEVDFEKSALSMHAKDKHPNNMSLNNFSVAVVKKVSPRNIKREEFRFIEKYRTKCFGLNRYKTLT